MIRSAEAGASFYDGTPGRQLVRCPNCRLPADALFGDHGDDAGCWALYRANLRVDAEVSRWASWARAKSRRAA